ncbi:MAG TPA: hypothetical protein VF230_02315 [Acidimicrobiales bacterium]
MRYFLLVYDRSKGVLLSEEEFESEDRALDERFEVEKRIPDDVEVVVLGAESREALQKTHSRYFTPLRDLLAG